MYIIHFPGIPKTRKRFLACTNLVPPPKTRRIALACFQKRRTTLEGVGNNNTYVYICISLLLGRCPGAPGRITGAPWGGKSTRINIFVILLKL